MTEQGKQERFGSTITQQMIMEAQVCIFILFSCIIWTNKSNICING